MFIVLKRNYGHKEICRLNEIVKKELIQHSKNTITIDDFMDLPQLERDKIKLLHGHMRFGLHKFFSHPCDYITVTRNPIDRIISEYNSRVLRPTMWREFEKFESSFRDFVDSDLESVNNYQTRVLAGIWPSVDGRATPLIREDFERAKHNLKNFFKVVGVTEQIDKTILVIAKIFGLKDPYYIQNRRVIKDMYSNAGQDIKEINYEISKETLDIMKNRNLFDMELYYIARELLNESMHKYNLNFIDIFKYKVVNNILRGCFKIVSYLPSSFKRIVKQYLTKNL